MHSSFYHSSTISETLDIVERGLRRLGISNETLRAPSPAALRVVEDVKPYAEVTPEMIGEMIRLSGLRLRQAEIARVLGCSQSAVSKHLTRLGIRQRAGRKAAA